MVIDDKLLTSSELETLMKIKEKTEARRKTGFKEDDIAYVLYADGEIEDIGGYSESWEFEAMYGNLFHSKEEAEKERNYRKVRAIMKRHANAEPTKSGKRYSIIVNGLKVVTCECFTNSYNDLAYDSREKAEEVILEIGEERIKRDYFGIM